MWPGCGFRYHNISETFFLPYSLKHSFRGLIDTAIALMHPLRNDAETSGPEADADSKMFESSSTILDRLVYSNANKSTKAADFVMMYYYQPDTDGHSRGTNVSLLADTLEKVT